MTEPARDDGTPTGKAYWRSVERLLASPAVQEELQRELARELPDGALDPPDELTRRGVLQLLAASFGLAGLTACRRPVEHIVPYVHPPEEVIPGIPLRYATTLPLGGDALGVVVESHEGRPTKVEGNPLHPSSHGAASAFAQAAVLGLYDPDRADRVRQGDKDSDWEAFAKWWAERAAALAGDGGGKLAVVAAPFSSPTLARLARELRAKYPQSRWATWDPLSEEALLAAHGDRRPVYALDRAKVVVALDCDLLLTEANAVHNAWGFAQARRPERPEGMLRLYAVESTLSLTGANADHRLALRPRHLAPFVAALARELGVAVDLPAPATLPAPLAARAAVMARDLRAAGAAGVVAAGRRQPAAVHAATLAINRALGSVGGSVGGDSSSERGVTLHPLDDAASGSVAELRDLTTAMAAGQLDTLVVLGGNPAHDAPVDLGFAAALAKVPHAVCLSPHRHETGRACEWHLPEAHSLEAWGDARAADGTASVVQPLIAPLLAGISRVELLGLLAGGAPQPGHDLVRATWAAVAVDDLAWHRVLHDGVAPAGALAGGGPIGRPPVAVATPPPAGAPVASTAAPANPANAPVTTAGVGGGPVAASNAEAAKTEAAAGELDLVILPSPAVWDGSFANNPWLQELPHPLSKLTWDNAAYLSPATAAALGVETGEAVLVVANGNRAGLPAVILPGMAEGTVAIELGYGRQGLGHVADGVGADAYPLRTSTSLWQVDGIEVHRTWFDRRQGNHRLGITQTHWELEGRPLVREATLAEYRQNPHFVREAEGEEGEQRAPALWEEPARWDESPQWAMAIDLSSCIGCNACVVACQSENNVPVVGREMVARAREMHWLRVDRYFSGEPESPEVVFQPVPCMHCENAPCEQVCPVAATVHDHQGLNLMVYNRCIGTRYCSNNCPYKVRRFNFFNYTKDTPQLLELAMNPDVTVRSRGVMEKCTYCIQRIVEARQSAKLAGRPVADGEIKTACQQTCPTQAIVFGDRTDKNSQLMARKGLPRDYVLLGELNNRPRTSYGGKVRNPNPEWV
ncbi:MAG TPA: TAT-variant-translocated molybdopterin oxidoreductase [Thermoanaerobaculia bacterium]|jgi:molybdopterin-containing oxidoreductase family iron-sulfur binding subunit|nr:TAT-variant-translocated molybdopterin oxidoreductase [Thermoanaerobaculia bacterium]